MSLLVRRAAFFGSVWAAGDFFAQFYGAHKEAAARRARGEAREGPRPSGAQMFNMLDKERLAQNFAFGLLAGSAIAQYERLLPRIFGPLARHVTPSLCALGLQQIAVTPLLLWSYYTAMTGLRGGLSDPSFMNAHPAGAYQRNDVATVERHITQHVMPYPLLVSWGVYTPVYLFAYLGPFRGASFLTGCVFVPWCGLLSYTQDSELL